MCRWFAYLSPAEPCLLEDVLIRPKNSLCQQVDHHYLPTLVPHNPHDPGKSADKAIAVRNSLFNMDGMGVAWYTHSQEEFVKNVKGLRPASYKSINPPVNDFNFRNLCSNTCSTVCFAHIRATSGSPVATTNNHPFIFGRHILMHNGVIADFLDIRRPICDMLDKDTFANILGSTDSEHLAALYMTILTKGRGKSAWDEEYSSRDMAVALHSTVATIIQTQQKVRGKRANPNSLNLATTDGKRLICYRFRNHATEQPPSLYYSTTAGVTLNRKYPGHPDSASGGYNELATKQTEEHGKHVIVASEPTTYKASEWKLIESNHCILVEANGEIVIEKIPYKEEWSAFDDTSEHENP